MSKICNTRKQLKEIESFKLSVWPQRYCHNRETPRSVLLSWDPLFLLICCAIPSDSGALTADEVCTQLKESWICSRVLTFFHSNPRKPHWKGTALAKIFLKTSTYEWVQQPTSGFYFCSIENQRTSVFSMYWLSFYSLHGIRKPGSENVF